MSAARPRKSGPSVKVKQIRSGIGFDKTQKATLRALGLGKLGRIRELPDNREVRGMITKIRHLVKVIEPQAQPRGDGE